MGAMNDITEKQLGLAFAKYCEQAGIRYVELAKQLGMKSAQTINHWKTRGVPTSKAVRVASILGCRPDQISKMELSEKDGDVLTGYAAKKRETKKAIDEIIERLRDPKALDLLLSSARSIDSSFSE